jgi:asparagine synthase (glutamine-hydrolysing)
VAEWFRGELKAFAYESMFNGDNGLLNHTFLTQCWNQHQRGQRDWSALLWTVLMFNAWQQVDRAA